MKDFNHSFKLGATTEEVYIALTNPFTIELWTGHPAKMSEEPGSSFELFDGDICGENIEFIINQKIVQEWYFGEQPEKSVVTVNLRSKGNYTIVDINHTNIPDSVYDEIKSGWKESIIEGLYQFFK
ncbi:MAG: SRPBCC domain-containing protein [Bacteroidales bacterium]